MRRGVLTFILLICCANAIGRTYDTDVPKFTFGTEWSYNATVYSHIHQYFISPEGFREEILDNRWKYKMNNELSLHAGYNFNIGTSRYISDIRASETSTSAYPFR